MRSRVHFATVTAGCAALVAGFLGTAVPTASATPPSVGPIETVGPIATVSADPGTTWPVLPPSLAQMPRGSVVNAEAPYLSVPGLRSVASLPVRVADVSNGHPASDMAWTGTLVNGWSRVAATLVAGDEYRVEVERNGAWAPVGSFAVSPTGAGGGPAVQNGDAAVSVATGQVTTSWRSPLMAGPVGTLGLGLTWSSGGAQTPGLPAGWRLSASASAWAGLEESASAFQAAEQPGVPVVVHARGIATATMSLEYPASAQREVSRYIVQEKVGRGAWTTVAVRGLHRSSASVTGLVTVPPTAATIVRAGVVTHGTIVWGRAAPVVTSARLVGLAARHPQAVAGAGASSVVTPGVLPAVVALTGWDGSRLTFLRDELGVYQQSGSHTPGFSNTLAWESAGVWEFTDTQGVVTRFESGHATTVRSKGALLATLAWDGQGRLASLTNEIGRTTTLRYSGSADCPSASWTGSGFAAPPAGSLCHLDYPDGTVTDLGYVAAGDGTQIAMLKNTGNTGASFGWDTTGRLVSTRSSLVTRAATANPAAANVLSRLGYDTQGRAATLTSAAATVGSDVVTTQLDFPVINEDVLAQYDTTSTIDNAARAATAVDAGASYGDLGDTYWLDPITWQALKQTNPVGLSISVGAQESTDTVSATRDALGRNTTYTYNNLGLVTKVSGPVTGSSTQGAVMTSQYDTVRTAGRDVPLAGLRAQVYAQTGFRGSATSQFWATDHTRGGLSAQWSGHAAAFSAQATGVWTPSVTEDAAGKAHGWQFSVTASGGTDAVLVVGGVPCPELSTACLLTGLPTGPKSVMVQLRTAEPSGWFEVTAAPAGQPLAPMDSAEVRPGFALTSAAASNDVLPDAPSGAETLYGYANPANARPTSVTSPGDLVTSMAYESSSAGSGQWGRLLTQTTPGGQASRTTYWADDATTTLPAVCGGDTVRESGQVKDLVRADGSTVRSYYDISGRLRAAVTTGTSDAQTTCSSYTDGGALQASATYDHTGALLESTTVVDAAGGNPLTQSVTVTHGDAAPVASGSQVTATTTVDLLGRTVSATDIAGTVTTHVYDVLGNETSRTSTPPAGSGASPLSFAYAYQAADGMLHSMSVNGTLAATVSYSPQTGAVSGITYADGVSVAPTWLDNGALGTVSAVTGDDSLGTVTDSITQSAYGRIESNTLRTSGTSKYAESRGYTYDGEGRLSYAVISSGAAALMAQVSSFGYRYAAAQDASCASAYAGAGRDGLRSGGVVDGAAYVSCHNAAGELTSTTDPQITGGSGSAAVTHDGLGRVLTIGGVRPATFTWGVGGQLAGVVETDKLGGNRVATTLDSYGTTVLDKTVESGAGTSTVRYAGAYVLTTSAGSVTGTSAVQYGLPGGAIVTTAPGSGAVMTIPGVEGAALVTVSVPSLGSGAGETPGPSTGLSPRFGPFGEWLDAPTVTSASGVPTYAWKAARAQETLAGTSAVTLMGARAYSPALGEFLSVDPIASAGSNLYSYTDGDPINTSDPTGGAEQDNTTLLSGLGAVGGLLASLGGGFLAGRYKGVARAIGALTATAGIAGAGVSTYIAAKSQSADDGEAIGLAVAATLVSGVSAYGAYRYGAKRAATAAEGRRASSIAAPEVPMTDALTPVPGSAVQDRTIEAVSDMFANVADAGEATALYKKYAVRFHPDKGGTCDLFNALKAARDERVDYFTKLAQQEAFAAQWRQRFGSQVSMGNESMFEGSHHSSVYSNGFG